MKTLKKQYNLQKNLFMPSGGPEGAPVILVDDLKNKQNNIITLISVTDVGKVSAKHSFLDFYFILLTNLLLLND